MHARHAKVERLAVRYGAAGHQGRDYRYLGQLEELPQLVAGTGADDAPAHVQHRSLGLPDEPGPLAGLLSLRLGHRTLAGQIDLAWPDKGGLSLQRDLADVDQHRPGPVLIDI